MHLSQLHMGIMLASFSALVAFPGLPYAHSLRSSIPQAKSTTANDSAKLVVTLGHTQSASSAAFSPDSRLVLTGGLEDHVAILWNSDTGREIRRFVGHRSSINSVAFSPDGRFVLTGGGESPDFVKTDASSKDDNSARLWDVSTGKEVRRFEGHAKRINAVLFSQDGGLIVTGSEDRTIRIWETSTGRELRRLTLSPKPVSALAMSPDGGSFVVGTALRNDDDHGQCDAYLIDARYYKILRTFPGHKRSIGSVSFSADGTFVATSAAGVTTANELFDDNAQQTLVVYQWDVKSGKRVRTFKGFGPVAFSSDSRFIFTAGAEDGDESFGGVQVRNLNTGEVLQLIKGSRNEDEGEAMVTLMTPSPDGKRILLGYDYFSSGGNDPRLDVHPAPRIAILNAISYELVRGLGGDASEIEGIAFSKNGQTFLSNGRLWTVDQRRPAVVADQEFVGSEQAVSDDGRLAYVEILEPSADKADVILDEKTYDEIAYVWKDGALRSLTPKASSAYAVRFSSDNRYLVREGFGEAGIEIDCYTVNDGALQWTYHVPFNFARAYQAHLGEDFSFSTISTDRSTVYVLPVRSEEDIKNKRPEGTLVAISIESGKVLRRYKAPWVGAFGKFVKVSPNGRSLIYPAGKDDSENSTTTLVSLDLNSGRLRTLMTQASEFYAAYSDDGRFVITAGLDGDVSTQLNLLRSDTGAIIHSLSVRSGFLDGLRVTADGKYFLMVGQERVILGEVQGGTRIRTLLHSGIKTAGFLINGSLVVTGGVDGTTRIWETGTGKELCRLIYIRNGDWVVMAADGRFDTDNLEDLEGLNWVMSDDPLRGLPPEIFMRGYYEPGLLPRLLRCTEMNNCGKEFKSVKDIAKLNRVQPVVRISDVSAPDADGYVKVTVEASKGEGRYLVNGNETKRSTGAYDVRLFRDGQIVGSWPDDSGQKLQQETSRHSEEGLNTEQGFVRELQGWRQATEVKPDKDMRVDSKTGMMTLPPIRVKLPQAKDASQIEFTAYAFNEDRIKSETARWQWSEELKAKLPKAHPVKPRAYIIAVGVNAYENPDFNLKFAADDARQMSQVISHQLQISGQYSEVVPITLVSDYETKDCQKAVTVKQATKDNFRVVLQVLGGNNTERSLLSGIENADRLQKATPDDLLLIMYSSHGYADASGNFYFIPYDTGAGAGKVFTDSVRQHSISSEELSLWLRDVDAGQMVMIVDACHSAAAIAGQDFKPGPMGSRGLGQLAYDKGMRILTATQTDNVAWEYPSLKQGMLTYALLHDGIEAGQADHNKDKTITLGEWLEYGVDRVPKLYQEVLTNSLQTFGLPAISQPNLNVASDQCGTPGGRKELVEILLAQTKSRVGQQPSLFDFTKKKPEVVLGR